MVPTMISWGRHKVLELSNCYENRDCLTKEQKEVMNVIQLIFSDDNIIKLETKRNSPKSWEEYHNNLKKQFMARNFCTFKEAFKLFISFRREMIENFQAIIFRMCKGRKWIIRWLRNYTTFVICSITSFHASLLFSLHCLHFIHSTVRCCWMPRWFERIVTIGNITYLFEPLLISFLYLSRS